MKSIIAPVFIWMFENHLLLICLLVLTAFVTSFFKVTRILFSFLVVLASIFMTFGVWFYMMSNWVWLFIFGAILVGCSAYEGSQEGRDFSARYQSELFESLESRIWVLPVCGLSSALGMFSRTS